LRFPHSEINPQIYVGFIERNNFQQRARRITALNVHRSVGRRQAENQTTRTIFVIRVIFDDFATVNCLAQLLNANAPQNALVSSMFRKLKQSGGNLRANLVNHAEHYTALLPHPRNAESKEAAHNEKDRNQNYIKSAVVSVRL